MAQETILIDVEIDSSNAEKRLDTTTKKLESLRLEQTKIKKDFKEGKISLDEYATALNINSRELSKTRVQQKRYTKQLNTTSGSLNASRQRLTRLKRILGEVNQSTEVGRLRFAKLATETRNLNKQILAQEKAYGVSTRNVGNYGSAFDQATSSILPFNAALLASPIGAVTIAMTALVGVGRQAFNFFRDFELIMSKVQATASDTTKTMNEMKEAAISLGEASKFTATEVGELFLELSKLGFTREQILNVSDAVINLATATDSELGRSAEIIAKTINQFEDLSKSQKDTARTSDVMAVSFSSSALDIEKFAIAMQKAGPIASLSGKSFEETTAIVAGLSDAGIEASTIGTSLRDIFADLAKSGLTWNKALDKIKNSTNQVKTANDIFGKTSLTVSTLLARNIEKVNDLTSSLDNASGAALKMADVVSNNLQGDIDRLSSSWEGLIARGSALNNIFRVIVTTITFIIDSIKDLGLDTIALFSPSGLLYLAIKGFWSGIRDLITQEIQNILEWVSFLGKKIGIEFNDLEMSLNKIRDINSKRRQEKLEEEQKKGVTSWQRYKDNLSKIWEEESDTQIAARLQTAEKLEKILNESAQKEEENNKILTQNYISELQERRKAQLEFDKRQNELQDKSLEAYTQLLFRRREVAATEAEDFIEIEKAKLLNALTQEGLTQGEKELLIFESEQRIADIRQKFRDSRLEADRIAYDNELKLVSGFLGSLGSLFNNETDAYKVFATAQTLIDTYANATKAYGSQLIIGDPTSIVRASIAAGTAIAQGIGNVAKINSVKFQKGGLIQGASHKQGGVSFSVNGVNGFEAEGGEFITNRKATAENLPLLTAINKGANIGGNFFQQGGVVTASTVSTGRINSEFQNSTSTAENLIKNMPEFVVSVVEIADKMNRVKAKEQLGA